MANKNLEQHREDLANAIIAKIESGKVADWKPGWFSSGFGEGDVNAVTGKRYSGDNSLLTYIVREQSGYQDNRWVTLKQANDLGGNVKKGEKGLKLVKYDEYDVLTKKRPDWKTINEMPLEDKLKYVKENVRIFANRFVVFNVEQCENLAKLKPLVEKTMTPAEMARQDTTFETIIKNSGAPVYHDGGNSAFYRISTDDIHLPEVKKFKTKQDYYATAMHEIAHSTGHKSRLNRELGGGFGSEQYAIEELRAEISSVFLQGDLGVSLQGDVMEMSTSYIAAWREHLTDKTVINGIIKDAKGIADYIEDNYLMTSKKEKAPMAKDRGGKGD